MNGCIHGKIKMVNSKLSTKISSMQEGGKKLGRIRDRVLSEVRVGIKTIELDKLAERLIKEAGGEASFKMVENYQWATCVCVNENLVHCPPGNYKLQKGDLVTLDIGMFYQGYHTDTAATVIVSKKDDRFLRTGRRALEAAINAAKAGSRVGYISRAMQSVIEESGYNVVRKLVGHGIGKGLHEKPQIPCFLEEKIKKTPRLKESQTLAIEVIYTEGKPEIELDSADNWTMRTQDSSRSAMFEHTIAITPKQPLILTK